MHVQAHAMAVSITRVRLVLIRAYELRSYPLAGVISETCRIEDILPYVRYQRTHDVPARVTNLLMVHLVLPFGAGWHQQNSVSVTFYVRTV